MLLRTSYEGVSDRRVFILSVAFVLAFKVPVLAVAHHEQVALQLPLLG